MKFKVKNILLVSFLAIAGFFGVSSTLINKQVNEQPVAEKAEAATANVFCKMTYDWWTTDSAAIGVYYWGGSSAGTSWPGVRMTEVDSDNHIWSYSVPDDITGLIFTRVNGSGEISDWGAKTANLTLQTDGKNLYTITSSEAVWGDPGVSGDWSIYRGPGDWDSKTVYFSNSTDRNNYFVRTDRGTNLPTGDAQWENHFAGSKLNYTYSGKYVYSAEVWDYYSGLEAMWIKYGDGSDGGSTIVSTPFNSFTSNNTYANKLWDGSAWKTVFTVDFNMNGHGTAPTGQYVASGGKVSQPSAPTATGYTFGGWYKEAGCTNAWNFSTDTVTSNKTLYAKWTEIVKYTVSASVTPSGYGTVSPTSISNVDSGTSYSVSGNVLTVGATSITATPHATADGYQYSFTGWTLGGATVTSGTITGNTSFVANFSRSLIHYTITYDRNNNGDSSAKNTSTSKTYGVSYTILNPTTFSWSPSSFRRFIGWADSREGIATHFVGDSYTTNAAKTLYYNEDWYNYRYKTDSDSDWIDLIHNDTGLDTENNMVQFAPASAHVLTHGDKLYFQVSTDGKTSWSNLSVTTYSGSNNNYDTTDGIKLTTTDTIYLKITKAGVYDCWVPGITDYTVRVNGTDVYSMVGWGTSGGGKEQMKATAYVYGQKGQILEVGNIGNYYRGYRNGGCTGIEERDEDLYFTITGMYTVYLIKEDGSHWDNIYVELDKNESANKWGSVFMANVGCDPTGVSEPSGWSSCATYYADLSDDTKNVIYAASGSVGGTTLQQAVARYDYAVSHHSSLTKFIVNSSSTPRAVASAINAFSPFNLIIEDEDNLSTIIIIAASSVALLSVTALSILVIKKRKNKEE